MSSSPRLLLGSKSPRRAQILAQLGVAFEVRGSEVEEVEQAGETPTEYALRVASDKGRDVARKWARNGSEAFVLSADTVVVADGSSLQKPGDRSESLSMIRALSGRAHQVITAVTLFDSSGRLLEGGLETTRVWFRELTDAEARAYVASREGSDKAGAYGIQGLGAGLVRRVEGCYFNVVGLPVVRTLQMLTRNGAIRPWPPGRADLGELVPANE